MSINQVMIAIQRENPEAFLNNNINLLKRGAILRMPSVNDVERISSSAAYNEVATQEEEWKGVTPAASSSMPLLSEDRAPQESDYTYPDHPTVTWDADKPGKAIFYHDRELNENFLGVVT